MKKLLTKETNIMTGLCLYSCTPELITNAIKHFPKWRIYKVKYRINDSFIWGLFLTNLKFSPQAKVTELEETITERYDNVDSFIDSFRNKYYKTFRKFVFKQLVHYDIYFVAIPKGCEILNLGTDDLTFR